MLTGNRNNTKHTNKIENPLPILSLAFPTHLECVVTKAATDRMIEQAQHRNPQKLLINSEARRRIHTMVNMVALKSMVFLLTDSDPDKDYVQPEDVIYLFDCFKSSRVTSTC